MNTRLKEHPIRIGSGEWTAVTGIMEGTFTQPMPIGDGKTIPPTGKAFKLSMVTIGHWTKDGVMSEAAPDSLQPPSANFVIGEAQTSGAMEVTSSDVEQTVLTYAAVWSEPDMTRTRELVALSLTPDAEILGPGYTFIGNAAIVAEAQRFLLE